MVQKKYSEEFSIKDASEYFVYGELNIRTIEGKYFLRKVQYSQNYINIVN